MSSSAVRGATLLELLAVVAVIGVLVSLILPAVLAATEASRRALCAHRLRQIGVALANYEADAKVFPAAEFTGGSPFAVQARLLPYLGLESVYDRIPFSAGMTEQKIGFNVGPVLKTPNAFICPSDPIAESKANYRCNMGPEPNSGRGFNSDLGPFMLGKGARTQEVTDGTSTTIFFSERITGDFEDSVFTPSRDLWYPLAARVPAGLTAAQYRVVCRTDVTADPHRSNLGRLWFYGGLVHSGYNHVLSPNSSTPDCGRKDVDNYSAAVSAKSYHNDGVNCLLGDGGVTFVSSQVDFQVWIAYSTRASGETTTLPNGIKIRL